MQLSFAPVKGESKNYKILVGVLAAIVTAGVTAYMIAYLFGFRLWGINNSVTWGQLITVDFFFIGLSAGSLVVSSLVYVLGQERYKPIGRIAVFMGLLLMIGAMLTVLTDLGRAEKFWRLFMYFYLSNMKSMFGINGIFYAGYILLLLTYLVAALSGSKLTKYIAPVAVLWAVLVHMGTGAIVGFIETRHVMYSPLKPVEFISAAFASGLALVMLLSYVTLKFTKRPLDKQMYVSLGKFLAVLIIILMVLVATDKLTHFYPPKREAVMFLIAGPWAWIFWLQVVLGYFIPLGILFNPWLRKKVGWVIAACAICVVGIFFERAAIIFPGLSQPLEYYPGEIAGIWGARGGFPIMPAETLQTLGIFAVLGLVYVLGLKFMDLLPAPSEEEHKEGEAAEAAAEGGQT
ncbi:MAG: polysulfide reductase NrfD [Dehalococcoidia bacterium]|nr:polysulfide reductase NrfD [Dehalococcoidia bacterium]